jgi:hypothetical protein
MRFQRIPGVKHFFNDGPAETVIDCLENCIPKTEPMRMRLPRVPRIDWPWPQPQSKLMASSSSS